MITIFNLVMLESLDSLKSQERQYEHLGRMAGQTNRSVQPSINKAGSY